VVPCKSLIRPISFMGKLVNQQGIVCNIYLQRVSFCRYLGGHPGWLMPPLDLPFVNSSNSTIAL
ncbi:hypothetical protein LC612_41275, partial [Nostoc sp. CHAB 5834]|nr:hypothetical protein [Nostoc sp. CHAB 5834]